MCWNASVSLNTYIFSTFASLFAYSNGVTNFLGLLFYQSFVIMQLIEYFIWTKTFSNRLLSQIALFVVLCQPILNILKIEKRPKWIPYLLVAYCLFIGILYTVVIPIDTIEFSSTPSKNGHLSWNWLKLNIYIIAILYAFLSVRWIIDEMYPTFIFITTILIISIILYMETYTWGSMWCWIANAMSLYLILRVFYLDFCKI